MTIIEEFAQANNREIPRNVTVDGGAASKIFHETQNYFEHTKCYLVYAENLKETHCIISFFDTRKKNAYFSDKKPNAPLSSQFADSPVRYRLGWTGYLSGLSVILIE